MDSKLLARIGAVIFIAIAITMTAIEMSRAPEPPRAGPAAGTELDQELMQTKEQQRNMEAVPNRDHGFRGSVRNSRYADGSGHRDGIAGLDHDGERGRQGGNAAQLTAANGRRRAGSLRTAGMRRLDRARHRSRANTGRAQKQEPRQQHRESDIEPGPHTLRLVEMQAGRQSGMRSKQREARLRCPGQLSELRQEPQRNGQYSPTAPCLRRRDRQGSGCPGF